MNSSHRSSRGGAFAALVTIALLAADPARAQPPAPPRPAAGVTSSLDRDAPPSPDAAKNEAKGTVSGNVLADLDGELIVAAKFRDPADEMLGATLRPVGDTLRAQLGIPAGQGLLVSALRGDGPSAQAGLKLNDVLLALGDKPLAAPDDLAKLLKAAGESAVPLKVLRAGQPVTLPVRPVYRVTLGPVAEPKTEYFIGVSIDAADDALRAQLALPSGQGVVVSEVIGGSPAEKAGVKTHDVVLEMGGKPIDSFDSLAREVQAARDQPTTLKVLRGGKPVTIPITGAVRKVEAAPPQEALRLWLVNQQQQVTAERLSALHALRGANAPEVELRRRLEHLEKEMKAIRASLDRLNETLKADKANKRD